VAVGLYEHGRAERLSARRAATGSICDHGRQKARCKVVLCVTCELKPVQACVSGAMWRGAECGLAVLMRHGGLGLVQGQSRQLGFPGAYHSVQLAARFPPTVGCI
jgi:hypothetical protein